MRFFGTICGSYAIILIQHLCWAGFCWTAGVIVQVRLNSQLPKHPPGVGLCSRPAAWCNGLPSVIASMPSPLARGPNTFICISSRVIWMSRPPRPGLLPISIGTWIQNFGPPPIRLLLHRWLSDVDPFSALEVEALTRIAVVFEAAERPAEVSELAQGLW